MVAEKEHMFFRPRTGSVPHGPPPPRPAPITRRGWVMNHSTWDLEVHAREMQRRRFREAERVRQIEAARQGRMQSHVLAPRFSISRVMTAVRDCLAPRSRPVADPRYVAEAPALAGTALRSLPREMPALTPDARAARLSQPYAGMMVLARGTS